MPNCSTRGQDGGTSACDYTERDLPHSHGGHEQENDLSADGHRWPQMKTRVCSIFKTLLPHSSAIICGHLRTIESFFSSVLSVSLWLILPRLSRSCRCA